jgi:predicted transcriptional regulator of viral defense system
MAVTLGEIESRLLAYAQMRNLSVIRSGDLLGPLRLTAKSERELLHRLAADGMIVRAQRGIYLVPSKLPLGGRWSPDEALVLDAIIADRGGRYQICGPNAFSHWGFTEQVPTRVYAYNNLISGERSVGRMSISLVKVADARLGGTEPVPTLSGRAAPYSSRCRSLVDAVHDWHRFGSLPAAFGWIDDELDAGRVTAAALARDALAYGNQSTVRRLGHRLARRGTAAAVLRKLERTLTSSSSLIPLDPTRPKRGPGDRRWGVVDNA